MKKPELLAPGGNLEKLKTAVIYGADAVYIGGNRFSLRAGADNFSVTDLGEGVDFAHARGRKVYVAVNIFAHNEDLEDMPDYLRSLAEAGVDALIVSDPGILHLVREHIPEMPVHLSTQANTTNWLSARFWKEQGVSRIIGARELTLGEMQEIASKSGLELEVFVHGAMCISYSGRCLLSNYLTGRDANRGDCAHPCRWKYRLVEEGRDGEYLPLIEEERGTYILSSRDLCLIEYLPDLIKAGVTSFKIEGRMKSINYVATVVSAYRRAIDSFCGNPLGYRLDPEWLDQLKRVSNRAYTDGFIFGGPGKEGQNYGGEIYRRPYTFIGLVKDYNANTGMATVEQRNHFAVGETIEVFSPDGKSFEQKITEIINEEGESVAVAQHPQMQVRVPLDGPLQPFTLLRRKNVL